MSSFFLHKLQLITVLQFAILTSPEAEGSSLWNCVRNFPFLIPFYSYWSLYFCSTKCIYSSSLKRHNPFKIKITEKPHTVLLPDLGFLSCNKNSMMSVWFGAPSPKADLVTNFLLNDKFDTKWWAINLWCFKFQKLIDNFYKLLFPMLLYSTSCFCHK